VRAADYYKRGCDLGDAVGCVNLGLMLLTGRDLPADPGTAATLFQRACDRGDMAGCGNAGLLYANGRGVPRDTERGRGLLRRACDAHLEEACQTLKRLGR